MTRFNIGYITGTHGIKGELKVLSDFSRQDLAFKVGNTIYIDDVPHKITSVRPHQNKQLITIDNLNDINEVIKYTKKNITILKETLNIDTFVIEELIGFKIILENTFCGLIESLYKSNAGYLLYIKYQKNYYIPFNDYFIKSVDLEAKIIYTSHIKELWL